MWVVEWNNLYASIYFTNFRIDCADLQELIKKELGVNIAAPLMMCLDNYCETSIILQESG